MLTDADCKNAKCPPDKKQARPWARCMCRLLSAMQTHMKKLAAIQHRVMDTHAKSDTRFNFFKALLPVAALMSQVNS